MLSELSSLEKRPGTGTVSSQSKEDRERWSCRLRQLEDELRVMRGKVRRPSLLMRSRGVLRLPPPAAGGRAWSHGGKVPDRGHVTNFQPRDIEVT